MSIHKGMDVFLTIGGTRIEGIVNFKIPLIGNCLYSPETNAERTVYYFYRGKKSSYIPQHFNCKTKTLEELI